LAPKVGTAERAHFYKWLVFLTNKIQADTMVHHYPEKHTADLSGTDAVKEQADHRLAAGFAVLEGALKDGPYLLGKQVSVCDVYLYMLCNWTRNLKTPPADFPRLRRLLDMISARGAVERACAKEGINPQRYAEKSSD
jgi:glutathione S-transferase